VGVVRQIRLNGMTDAAFLGATAQYLGTSVAALRHEVKAGRTPAEVASSTPGRSAKQLVTLLVSAASTKLQLISDRAMSTAQKQALRRMIRPQITGFLNDTCALGLASLGKRLAGCPGMGA
jgi:hypothetical protein